MKTLHPKAGNPRETTQAPKFIGPKFGGKIIYRSLPVIVPFLSANNNNMLPVFENFNAGNIYFSALIDSGTTVNVINTSVFNKLPNYIKRRMSNIRPSLSSVTGHDLDVKRHRVPNFAQR